MTLVRHKTSNSLIPNFPVTIIDANHISRYLEILARMKTTDNRIVAIGSEDDWEILLALASIGFDRRKNLYLFNTMEFDTIIKELRGK